MNVRTLLASQPREWQELLSHFSQPDVYFTAEYHLPYESLGEGRACAFYVQEGQDRLLYPFMLRPIDAIGGEKVTTGFFDIQTVYGYSGPLSTTSDPEFLARAWRSFGEWCRSQRVVAEFIRFHPLLGNHQYVTSDCRVSLDRETVAIDLAGSVEELWARAPAIHRNMVRKSITKGLSLENPDAASGMPVFRELYARTMARLGASDYYAFSEGYFTALAKDLQERLKVFVVRSGETPVAAALFLLGSQQMHYHLSGSDERFQHAAPNNFLLHSAALWGRERGFKWLHLGGGRTNSPEDSLFRFKARISNRRFPFYIGRRVHMPDAYENLCAEWLKRTGCAERPQYLLLYRLQK